MFIICLHYKYRRENDQSFIKQRSARVKEILGATSIISRTREVELEGSTSEDITAAFSKIIAPGRNKAGLVARNPEEAVKAHRSVFKQNTPVISAILPKVGETSCEEEEVYIPYMRDNIDEERGFAVNESSSGFEQQAQAATFAVDGDDITEMHRNKQQKTWYRHVLYIKILNSFFILFIYMQWNFFSYTHSETAPFIIFAAIHYVITFEPTTCYH